MRSDFCARRDICAVIDQNTSAIFPRRLFHGIGYKEQVSRRQVALANLDHIYASRQRAFYEMNQRVQSSAAIAARKRQAVCYRVQEWLRATVYQLPHFAIVAEKREQSC